MGFSKKQIDDQYQEIVDFAEIERFMDQKLKNYSSGMQVRLAFSLAIRAKADILLVDEVLAVGDADFQRKCLGYFKELKADKKTVVFVTHDMSSVREYCDRAILIDKSEMQIMGSAQDVSREYSQLFMVDDKSKRSKKTSKRWGNEDVSIQDVKVSLVKDEVVVDIIAKVQKPVDKVIYGLHVIAQDGVEITAMNNRMIQTEDIKDLAVGQEIKLQWRMLNIFNDGKYTVTLTLVDDVYNTLDWMTDAASFVVKRLERSTTSVLPPVTTTFKIL